MTKRDGDRPTADPLGTWGSCWADRIVDAVLDVHSVNEHADDETESALTAEQERRASALYHARGALDRKPAFGVSAVKPDELIRLADWIINGDAE